MAAGVFGRVASGASCRRALARSRALPVHNPCRPTVLLEEPAGASERKRGGPRVTIIEGSSVAVGIDAAVVANHHIVVRRPEVGGPGAVVDDFVVPPTLAGMERLTKRLAAWPGAGAVAEPTSMTWFA